MIPGWVPWQPNSERGINRQKIDSSIGVGITPVRGRDSAGSAEGDVEPPCLCHEGLGQPRKTLEAGMVWQNCLGLGHEGRASIYHPFDWSLNMGCDLRQGGFHQASNFPRNLGNCGPPSRPLQRHLGRVPQSSSRAFSSSSDSEHSQGHLRAEFFPHSPFWRIRDTGRIWSL